MEYVIEDILHYLVDTLGVETADKAVLTSISRQVKKGTALTDRQYDLVKNKLFEHKDKLLEHNILLNESISTRLPIRSIDRSKYISILHYDDVFKNSAVEQQFNSNYSKTYWIKVRFPFSKKDISRLENITRFVKKSQYKHEKGSHEHYFCLTAKNAYLVCNTFDGRNFNIDPDVVDLYKKVKTILESRNDYIPFTENGEVFNVSDYVKEYIDTVSTVENRELICADRSIMFGYESEYKNEETLVGKIASRKSVDVSASPELYGYKDIVDAIVALNRFPVVVLIDHDTYRSNNSFDQVKNFYNEFSKFIPNEQQAVLFREETNSPAVELNDFVKNNNLNNWVDKNTKVVYIKKNKLPKLLIGNDFKPITAVANTSTRLNNIVESYIKFNCDLVLFNDDVKNFYNKWSVSGYL